MWVVRRGSFTVFPPRPRSNVYKNKDLHFFQVALSVVVHIIDKNDNRPEFSSSLYTGSVSEGAVHGSPVLTIDSVPLILRADDRDSNLNSLLLYSIIEPDARRYFNIDANTGAVSTALTPALTPDRESRDRFEFTVHVRDQGKDT